jgi:hypothetical protein
MAVAAAAVNNFRTITSVVGLTTTTLYEAPVGFVGVFLLAQCSNVGSTSQTISFYHNRNVSGFGTVTTEIVKDYYVPPNDTLNLLPGKLVLETGDFISVSASNATNMKFLASILETSNA